MIKNSKENVATIFLFLNCTIHNHLRVVKCKQSRLASKTIVHQAAKSGINILFGNNDHLVYLLLPTSIFV